MEESSLRREKRKLSVPLHELRHQIIVVGLGNLTAVEVPGLRLHLVGKLIHENLAVDLRSVHGGTSFKQQIGFFRSALEQQIDLASHQSLLLLSADLLLDSHQMFAPALDLALPDLILEMISAGTF